jgi:GAF domain-containing protein/ActR/RegA family two-component response regulator
VPRRPLALFLVLFVLIAVPLGVLAGAGVTVALRQLGAERDRALSRTVGALTALVRDVQEVLERESGLLAREPAVVEGTARRDWSIIARGASPRLLAITREGFADLVVIRDAAGSPLVQVPSGPPPALPDIPPGMERHFTVALVGGQPYLLASAAVFGPGLGPEGGRAQTGLVILARRLESMRAVLERLPSRPGLVLVAGDRALGSTRAGLMGTGWAEAVAAGRTAMGPEVFALRQLGPEAPSSQDGALWALLPETDFEAARRRLLLRLGSLVGAGALILTGSLGLIARWAGRLPAHPQPEPWHATLERRNRELEALNAVAATIGRSADLVTTAEETLEVVRGLARMDLGAVYRLDRGTGSLVLLAHRGMGPEEIALCRIRPLDASLIGDAVRAGRVQVTQLDATPPTDPLLRRLAAQRLHQTQLALPIPVKGEPWGVMALVSRQRRDFAPEELAVLDSVAHQVGVAVERAQLQETAAARLSRLEAQREIERHISEQLDLEKLLAMVASAALRLIGGSFSVVYLRDGDELRARAWTEVGDWIREVRIPVGAGVTGRAVREGRGMIVNDYAASPLALPSFAGITDKLLAQPLAVGGRGLGCMVISRDQTWRPFTEEDLAALGDLATQAVVAIENARLFAEARQSAAEYRALFEVGGLIASTLDVDRVLDVATERCCAVIGAAAAGVFRLDAEAGSLSYARGRGLTPEFVQALRVRVGEGTSGKAVETRAPVWSRDLLNDPAIALGEETRALVEREGYRAVLSVPIVSQGEPLGALAAYWWEPRTPSASEIGLMTAMAGQAAVALDNARLFAAATAREKRLAALARLTQTLTATLSLEDVLSRVVQSAVELFGSGVSRLWLVDEGGETLSQRAHAGASPPELGLARLAVGEGLMGRIVATRAPLVVPDLRVDPRVKNRARIQAEGTVSFAGVPVMRGDRVLGALSIALRERREFTDEDLNLLQSLADHAAIAIENARIFAEEQGRKAHLAALLEINKKIGALAPTEALLTSIAEEAARLLELDNAGFRLLDGDELVVAGLAGTARETMLRERIKVGESLSGKVVSQGRALICAIDSVPDVVPEHRAADRRLGYTTFMGVPLSVGERTVGVLAFRARRPFTREDQEIAEAFAGQAAVALEHARLYREVAQQAERMRAVAELGRTLVSTFDVNRILDTVVTQARETLDVFQVGICLQDPATGRLRFIHGPGFAPDFVESHTLEPGEGAAGRAVAEGRPVWTSNILEDPGITLRPETRQRIEAEGTRAVLALPLIRERPFGALVVHREVGHRFTDLETEYLSAFASQLAVALDNARLYEALEVRAGRLRTLARLTHIVSSSLDMDEVLRAVARAAAEIMGSPFVSVYVADEAAQVLELRAASDERMGAALPARRRAFGEGLVGWVAEHRQVLDVPDVLADPRARAREWARAHELRSFFGAPIMFQDSLLGVLTLSDTRPFRLGPDDTQLLDSFVAQAGVAIRNARLYAETRQRLAETRALLEVEEILNSTLDPRQLLKKAAIKIAQVCRVDRCTIERWDGDRVIPLMSQFADGRRQPELWARFTTLPAYVPGAVPAHARAVETRRPVVIHDTSATDQIPREWIETFSLKSYMVVPLLRQDEVIGVMNLDYCERVTPFEPWQVDLAMAIGGELALSLENVRLYGEVQERLRETTTLLRVGRVLSEPAPPVEVMRRVAREVAHAFGADMAGVYEVNPAGGTLDPVAGYRVPKDLLELFQHRPFRMERFAPLFQSWVEGRAVWSRDVTQDPRFDRETLEGVGPLSVLFAPTPVRGQPVGALFLAWLGGGREFQPEEVRLIEGVAAQVGLAMENAELGRQTQLKLQETETLLSVSRTLASTLDLDAVARQFLREVVKAVGADAAGIWLLDESGEWLEPFVGYHVPPEWLDRLRVLRLSVRQHPFYAEAARTRQPVLSTDVMTDPRIPDEARAAAPHRTQLFVPIVAKERMVGGFAVTWLTRARELSPSELRLMEAVASQAAVALENARLFRDNQRRVEELSVLHELSRAVTGQLDQAGVLETMRQQVARVLDVRHMVIVLLDEAAGEFQVALRVKDSLPDESLPRRYPVGSVGLMSVVLETGRPIRTDDYAAECARRGVQPVATSVELRHWLGVPMVAGAQKIGVIGLRRRERPFSAAEERLLANIADLAALALRSARLFEERARAYAELAAAQDQLVRAEKLRALGEMASGVAHDFNNVLASILGRAQLLLDRVQDVKQRQWLQVIERAALDGARTVRRLQEFTRIRRDQPAVPVDLNEVVHHVLEATESAWGPQASSRGVRIEVSTALEPGLPRVAGDPAELREALINLVLNAVDAMPDGGRLSLSTRRMGGEVEVAVSDTGVGIPEAIRQKIFDPFFTTKGPRGTGLGLSMTYGILSRHGARVAVESAEGRGTTFRLAFPVPAAELPEPGPPASPLKPAGALRCLVVDDEEPVGEVLGDILAAAGQDAAVVASGAEALARLAAEPFDLVFTDLAMPGMTGWEVARAVKARWPHIGVVLVTGFGVEVGPENAKAHGVDLVMAKPLKVEDVLAALAGFHAAAGREGEQR